MPKTVANRIADLARLGQVVFHADDLANLWHIQNFNTLYITLHRYVKKGLFFRIYKGMYALKPVDELDPLMLGIKALHRFGYVSTETVLAAHGIIQQKISAITLVSDISKQFSIGAHRYRSRKLNDRYLYNPAGIITQNDVPIATLERAIADILYFNPRAYFDGSDRVDWQKVHALQKEIGYTPSNSPSKRGRNNFSSPARGEVRRGGSISKDTQYASSSPKRRRT